ncbi:MAG: hypothetical protein IT372_04680, partial [Polyangiaceae bacterium]|nr:hypothetical protein [Polyangiaceae bacterium]
MRSWLALRIACAALVPAALFTMFPACGSRTGDWAQDGDAAGCHDQGDSCADGVACCSGLACSAGACKPAQICKPQGDACALTTDCCDYDCFNGFCGGYECRAPGCCRSSWLMGSRSVLLMGIPCVRGSQRAARWPSQRCVVLAAAR